MINTINGHSKTLEMECSQIIKNHTNCKIRFDEKAFPTRVTSFIIDNEISLIIESKDEDKGKP